MPNPDYTNLTHYQSLYEQAPVALILVNTDLHIQYANRLARELFNLLNSDDVHPVVAKTFNQYLSKDSLAFYEWLSSRSNEPLDTAIRVGMLQTHIKIYQRTVSIENRVYTSMALLSNDHNKSNQEAIELYKLLFENVHFGILIMDAEKQIMHFNTAFHNMLGYFKGELNSHKFFELFEDYYDFELLDAFQAAMREHGFWNGRLLCKNRKGEYHPFEVEMATIREHQKAGEPIKFYIAFFRNIDQQIEKEKTLVDQANTDWLTGVLNRQGFLNEFERCFLQAQRYGTEISLLFIDLDNFKSLNDLYGHEYGDELLKAFSQRLVNHVKKNDIIGRMGGDEFVVLITAELTQQELATVGQKLVSLLSQPYQLFGIEYMVSASIGAATYPNHGLSTSSLLVSADSAMYQAKALGKNVFKEFDLTKFEEIDTHKRLLSDVEEVMEKQGFSLLYEPIVYAKTGEVESYYVMPAWLKYDVIEPLSPQLTLALYDDLLIYELGFMWLQQLYDDLNTLKKHGHSIRARFHLSSTMLENLSIQKLLKKLIFHRGVLSSEVAFLLSEENIKSADTKKIAQFNALLEMGFELMLDNFGDGEASIHSIMKLPLSGVLLSPSLVAKVNESSVLSPEVLQAILSLLQTLQVPTYAKGVENPAQHSFLNSFGCQHFQGKLFYSAMNLEQLREFLNAQSDAIPES